MRQPGHRPAQQLALAADLGQLGPGPGPELGEALGVGLALADEAEEVGEAATSDGEGDHGRAQAEDDPDGQRLLLEGQGRKFSKYRLGVGPRWPWYFDPRPGRAVGLVGGRGHAQEADLPDLHAGVDGDGEVGHVGELQGEVTVPAGVHEAGRGVDEEPQPPQGGLALEPGHQVVGDADPLQGRPQDELPGVEDERLPLGDLDQLGEVLEVLSDVDYAHGVVTEQPKVAVHVEVHRGRLDAVGAERVDDDPLGVELFADRPI